MDWWRWFDFADANCGNLSVKKQEELCGIFRRGSLLELEFWEMAYGGGR